MVSMPEMRSQDQSSAPPPPNLRESGFIPPEELIVLEDSPLGFGSFGQVYHGFVYHQEVAIKVLNHGVAKDLVWTMNGEVPADPSELDKMLKRNPTLLTLDREVFFLQQLRHENVLNFMGFCVDPPCLVTEYCEKSSLYDVIGKIQERPSYEAKFNWKRRIDLAYGAAKGMMYLHTRTPPVVHTDLKSPNLLVTKCWKCKVADFGTCKFVDPKRNQSHIRVNNPCWLAPEVMNGAEATMESDVYPMGIILWELLTLRRPFESETGTDVYPAQIQGGVLLRDERPAIPEDLGATGCPVVEEYVQLMKECWDKDPKKRPTFPDIASRLIKMQYAIRGKAPVKLLGRPLVHHQNGKMQRPPRACRDPSVSYPTAVRAPLVGKQPTDGVSANLCAPSGRPHPSQTYMYMPHQMSDGTTEVSPTESPSQPPRLPQRSKRAFASWFSKYVIRWMACLRAPRVVNPPAPKYYVGPPAAAQVVHDTLETPVSPFDIHRQKFFNRAVSNISDVAEASADPEGNPVQSGTVGSGVPAIDEDDDATDSSCASETSCSPNCDGVWNSTADNPPVSCPGQREPAPPPGYPGAPTPTPPPGYPGASNPVAGPSAPETLSASVSFPNHGTSQDPARLRQLVTVMSKAYRSKTMGARQAIRVVSKDPPSLDKWQKMRSYVLRGDVQTELQGREEWKGVVKFAQENESAPEKTGWDQCIKLVFGNSKIRHCEQWDRVKEFMVGDGRLEAPLPEADSEPLFEDLSSVSFPEALNEEA